MLQRKECECEKGNKFLFFANISTLIGYPLDLLKTFDNNLYTLILYQ